MRTILIFSVLFVAGCVTTPKNDVPPVSAYKSCSDLRNERARVISVAQTAKATLAPMYAVGIQNKARRRLARIDQRAVRLECEGWGNQSHIQ